MIQEKLVKIIIVALVVISTLVIGAYSLQKRIEELEQTITARDQEINQLEEANTILREIVGDIYEVEETALRVNRNINRDQAREIARKIVGASRKYEIPLQLAVYTAWAESDFHWRVSGPCGERSMVQVMRRTFYGMRPNGDYNDLDQVFDAGMHYLRVCWQRAQERAGGNFLVAMAYYNAGSGWPPDVALRRASVHVRRVQGIMTKAERMRAA